MKKRVHLFRQLSLGKFFATQKILIVFSLAAVFASSLVHDLYAQRVEPIAPEKFTEIMNSLSEEGGYYQSDIWITNEQTYLDVIGLLKERSVQGGVYIGVAPNQNFTYIAAIKPELAFIVDIRHQNRMQHLVYKILFELSETRAEFFSYLFAKPLDPKESPSVNADINEIVNYFYNIPSDRDMFNQTQSTIIDILQTKYNLALNSTDIREINAVLQVFYQYNLSITSGGGQNRRGRSNRPTFAEILRLRDPAGKQLNAFNSREDYVYLRTMNLENKIIPVTGNFAGSKALSAVAQFLKERNLTVTAFYVSNVERYLFQDRIFNNWARNVKLLPIDENSVFIRNISSNYRATRLQLIQTFISNFDSGRYRSYYDLILLDYIRDNNSIEHIRQY
ncbi:hypothetical protein AMJ80_07310 [bacterium SM23_31]|nr:MAG: hypothetical protein AMJ80_07310 [bacterium SM23_31]